ncbi:oxidoreductase-like domain-containing protein [Piscinibacter terrae]|uniref:Oxidoreductase n=1 Tax=Piscinibacter terrae TaxID=2496871 RepID=A0A3N7HU24_9BURK|nr:oxidoreductase-like domain-containing protein [Albitalea terrae]RQP24796.1 oxidoreductase [Albitalea terrae]
MPSTPPDPSDPEPQAPLAPGDDECCGNGCDPCIFDFYAIERERFLKEHKAWQDRQAARTAKD